MTNQNVPAPSVRVNAPEGVYVGTEAVRRANGAHPEPYMSRERIRQLAAEEDSSLNDLVPFDQTRDGYLNPVGIGDPANPWELWSRTNIRSYDEAATYALELAFGFDGRDPRWAGTMFEGMHFEQIAYQIELVLRKSIEGEAHREALMGQVGMLIEDLFQKHGKKGSRMRRKPQEEEQV